MCIMQNKKKKSKFYNINIWESLKPILNSNLQFTIKEVCKKKKEKKKKEHRTCGNWEDQYCSYLDHESCLQDCTYDPLPSRKIPSEFIKI